MSSSLQFLKNLPMLLTGAGSLTAAMGVSEMNIHPFSGIPAYAPPDERNIGVKGKEKTDSGPAYKNVAVRGQALIKLQKLQKLLETPQTPMNSIFPVPGYSIIPMFSACAMTPFHGLA
jgi:hypothetical protein